MIKICDFACDIVAHIVSFLSIHDLFKLSLMNKSIRKHAILTWRFQSLLLTTPQFGTPSNFRTLFKRYVVGDALNIEAGVRIVFHYIYLRSRALIDGCVVYDDRVRGRDYMDRWQRLHVVMKNAVDMYTHLDKRFDKDSLIKVLACIHYPLQAVSLRQQKESFKDLLQLMLKGGDEINWSKYTCTQS